MIDVGVAVELTRNGSYSVLCTHLLGHALHLRISAASRSRTSRRLRLACLEHSSLAGGVWAKRVRAGYFEQLSLS